MGNLLHSVPAIYGLRIRAKYFSSYLHQEATFVQAALSFPFCATLCFPRKMSGFSRRNKKSTDSKCFLIPWFFFVRPWSVPPPFLKIEEDSLRPMHTERQKRGKRRAVTVNCRIFIVLSFSSFQAKISIEKRRKTDKV